MASLYYPEPLLLKDPQLAEELPQLQAAGQAAIHLGVALDGLAGHKAMKADVETTAAQMLSIGGTAAIATGVAVFLIGFHTEKASGGPRLMQSHLSPLRQLASW